MSERYPLLIRRDSTYKLLSDPNANLIHSFAQGSQTTNGHIGMTEFVQLPSLCILSSWLRWWPFAPTALFCNLKYALSKQIPDFPHR